MMEPFDLVGWLGSKPFSTVVDFGWGVKVVIKYPDGASLVAGAWYTRSPRSPHHIEARHEALTNAREFLDRIGHSGEPS